MGALPMFDDTQIDTLKLVETGQSVSRSVSFPYGIKNVLGTEDETLSPLKAASVQKSSESRCGSRGDNILDSPRWTSSYRLIRDAGPAFWNIEGTDMKRINAWSFYALGCGIEPLK